VVTDTNAAAVNAKQLSTTNSFIVVVNEVNVAPTPPVQTNRTINELTLLTVTNTASDSDLRAEVTATGSLTSLSDAVGNVPQRFYRVLLVLPAGGQVPVIQTINVINGIATITWNSTAGHTYRVQYKNNLTDSNWSDLPSNTLSYQLLNPPAGAVINSRGVITWTPTEEQGPSTNTFTTVVTDNGVPALSTTNSFIVVVNEVNTAPVLPGQVNRVINEQTLLTVVNTASDSDLPANGLSYTLSGPSGASIDANGVITWTPTEGQGPDINTFTTVVTDTNAAAVNAKQLRATNSFMVVVNEVNVAPTLPAQTDRTINELTLLVVTNAADDSDVPANGLSYALSGPSGASIDANGVITWTPTEGQGPGINTFVTVVTDTNAAAVNAKQLSATNSFVVVVNEVNVAPTLPTQTDRTINELSLLTVTNTASDSDVPANGLSYALSGPSGASIDANGVINWTPAEGQGPSTNTFTTVVTDTNAASVNAKQLSATNSFMVVVNEVNTAPVLLEQTNRTINELTLLTVTNTASDGDMPANGLNYVLSGPSGASIDANGVITWTPTEWQGPSTNTFTTVVTDTNPAAVNAKQLSATNSFVVVVNEVNVVPVLPAQADRTIPNRTLLTVTNTASDSDVPVNLLSYVLSGPSGSSIDANGVIAWTPGAGQGQSTNTFVTVVTDTNAAAVNAKKLSATNSFVVVVVRELDALIVPNPIQLQITSVVMSNGFATINWNSVADQTYRVQYKSGFNDEDWTDLSPDTTAAGPTASKSDEVGGVPQRFYRVMLVP
jgi:predicted transcriptional regulator